MWEYDINQRPGGGLGPLIANLLGDGDMKIVAAGDNTPDPDWLYVLNNDGTLLWKKQLGIAVVPHNPLEIYDLDNDGQMEIICPGPSGMQVFKPDGSVYWTKPISCSESHIVVMDTDQNGYPYIFASNSSSTGTAKLRKIDGRTGDIVKQIDSWYPCHGGISGGVIDGRFQIFMSDRNFGVGAKGIQSYDADLNLLWSRPTIGCSSHLPILVDVTGNGVLDVVISQQRHDLPWAGIYCLNAKTGANIPGKYQDAIPQLEVHEAFPVHDIKGDGQLRLATSAYSPVSVFNIGTWQVEAVLSADKPNGKGPSFGKVWDDKFNIILADEISRIRIYSNEYELLTEIPGITGTSYYGATVQDIDNDGFNELITITNVGLIRVFKTTGIAEYPLPRTNTNHYSERNTRTATYIPPPELPPRIIDDTYEMTINVY